MEIKAKSTKLSDLRHYLEQERGRLTKEIEHSQITTDEERSGYSTHMADDATAVFEQERNVGMQHAQKRLLAEVEDALKRMDAGSYGVCRHCGARIDVARLKAMPTAALCLSCQEQQEQHNNWHG
ncbi:MAG: TraR/DksA C4-type zinc finger protein [Anaerolineae bacterium]|nr:TraR/DksA C4-type zinc finger protein [Anaerolineae bacterium]